MKVLKQQQDVPWAPAPNTVELLAGDTMPPPHLCTSAYAFVFDAEGRLLMADLDRGLDIPGGHLDPGEDPAAGMRREVLEETGVTVGAAQLFAVQKVTVAGAKPDNYAYPYPVSYQLMYISTDFKIGAFTSDEDSKGMRFIPRDESATIPWLQKNREMYEYAYGVFRQSERAA